MVHKINLVDEVNMKSKESSKLRVLPVQAHHSNYSIALFFFSLVILFAVAFIAYALTQVETMKRENNDLRSMYNVQNIILAKVMAKHDDLEQENKDLINQIKELNK